MSQPITLSDASQSLFSFVSASHSNDIHASFYVKSNMASCFRCL